MLKNFLAAFVLVLTSLSASNLTAQCNLIVTPMDSTQPCDTMVGYIYVNLQNTSSPTGGNCTYLWSNGSNASYLSWVPGGVTYCVTVTDLGNGCVATGCITTPIGGNPPTGTATVVQQACNNPGGLGGIVDLTVTGGTAPYTFSWDNGAITEDVAGLSGGYHYVSFYDANGCYGSTNVFLNGIPIYQPYVVAASCNQNNGAINAFVSASTPSFVWSNGATTMNVTGLAQGWYGVTITETGGNNCVLVQDYYVGYDPNCETTISGNVYNSTVSGVCNPNNPVMSYSWISATNTATGWSYWDYVDMNGGYSIGTRVPGNYQLEFHHYWGGGNMSVVCPSGNIIVTTTAAGGSLPGNDLYVQFPNTQDLEASLWSGGAAPGFDHYEYVQVCNNGGMPMTGNIDLTYDPLLTFGSNNAWWYNNYAANVTFIGDDPTNHVLTYSFTNLQPGTCTYVYPYFTLSTNATLGTVIYSSVTVTPTSGDATPADNVDNGSTTVVSSFDPNDIQVAPAHNGNPFGISYLYPAEEELTYVIRFQNTGTAPARRVVVRDQLDANLLKSSISKVSSSHAMSNLAVNNNNELVFEFNNIMLADSHTNEEQSHGFVKFSIRRTAGLALGTQINNTSNIYFDYNAPVVTNTATSIIAEPVSVEHVATAKDLGWNVMPNPFNNQITVQYELKATSAVRLNMMNSLGQVVGSYVNTADQVAGQHQQTISTEQLASGVYFIQIETAQGKLTQKIVKR